MLENSSDLINALSHLGNAEKDWVDILSALLTPTIASAIALLAVLITFFQWQTNHLRLKHELFERRYEQYKAVMKFLTSILQKGTANDDDRHKFYIATNGSGFIFDKCIYEYIEEIIKKSGDLENADKLLKNPQDNMKMEEIADKKGKIFSWFKAEFNKLNTLEHQFVPYLHLSPPGIIDAWNALKKWFQKTHT